MRPPPKLANMLKRKASSWINSIRSVSQWTDEDSLWKSFQWKLDNKFCNKFLFYFIPFVFVLYQQIYPFSHNRAISKFLEKVGKIFLKLIFINKHTFFNCFNHIENADKYGYINVLRPICTLTNLKLLIFWWCL